MQWARSTHWEMQVVAQRMRLKYELAFHSHFANFVNELIYDNIYTQHRVETKDLLHRINDQEYMTGYVDQQGRFEEESLIALHAQLFQSPLRITTEMPLMILTDTRDIFMRRKKRMRKLITNESSCYSDDSSSISPESLFSQSTVMLLEQSLNDLTFMNLSSSLNSYFSSTGANIYSRPSSILQEKEVTLFKLDPSQCLMVRELVESQVRHLILEFHSKQSSETHESIKSKKDNLPDFSEQAKDVSHHEVRISHGSNRTFQIESVVKAELKRYKIGQMVELSSLNSSSRVSKVKKRVREKAQQLLRNIRSSTII